MRVLVTGSGGFVGGWMMEHLEARGDDASGLDPAVDVLDKKALQEVVHAAGADAICHLAAQASVAASWRDPMATWSVNTLGTVNLLEAAASAEPRPRVLLISSAEVYGTVEPDELPIREDHPLRPSSPYAASKVAAEVAGLQFWRGKGLDVVLARAFNHAGPGQRQDFVVPSLAGQVVDAKKEGISAMRVGNLSARRDVSDVRDVVRAYRTLLEFGAAGEGYNVCNGRSVAIAEIAERLLRLAGVDIRIEVDESLMRPVDLPDLRGDPSKIRGATGWEPEIGLDDTLADVLASLAGA